MSVSALKSMFEVIAVRDATAAPMATETAHATKGTDLDVTVPSTSICAAAQILDDARFTIEAVTGVDWIAENQMEVVYDFTLFATGQRVTVRTRIPRDNPELPTISCIYSGANWHEREAHDFFGIVFIGHPNLSPFILPEDSSFHPLRKDFTA